MSPRLRLSAVAMAMVATAVAVCCRPADAASPGGTCGVADAAASRWGVGPRGVGEAASGGAAATDAAAVCAAPRCCFPTGASVLQLTDAPSLLATLEALKQGEGGAPAGVFLFYGQWCPFSSALLPLFRCLPQFFVGEHLQFFAVRESDVGLRTLIQLGVDAFPTLRVVQASGSAPVPGPRTLPALIANVAAATSVAPCNGPLDAPQGTANATCLPVPIRPAPGEPSHPACAPP